MNACEQGSRLRKVQGAHNLEVDHEGGKLLFENKNKIGELTKNEWMDHVVGNKPPSSSYLMLFCFCVHNFSFPSFGKTLLFWPFIHHYIPCLTISLLPNNNPPSSTIHEFISKIFKLLCFFSL